jgi:hypothetical protein
MCKSGLKVIELSELTLATDTDNCLALALTTALTA